MKICFIAAGPYSWGSSRFRCYWVAKHLGASVVTREEVEKTARVPIADVYVLQKIGLHEQQGLWLKEGKQVWLDHCDPMWWFSPKEMRRQIEHCTGVVCSNPALVSDFTAWSGRQAVCIPDRMDLEHYDQTREHRESRPVRLIWFGGALNRVGLAAAWANLGRLTANDYDIELTIMDDRPSETLDWGTEVRVYHVPFSVQHEPEILASHDIAVLPPYPGPWGRVKSNNRTLSAWACGLPVTTGEDYAELEALVQSAELRARLGAAGRRDVEQMWRVEQSAAEWRSLLEAHG